MGEKFIKAGLFPSGMGLEQEMERFGEFQKSSLRASSEARPSVGNIGAVVTSAEPCGCLYQDFPVQKQYRIPRATENPAVHRGMLRRWIINFHEMNEEMPPLPKGFHQRTKEQLQGMYYDMLRQYDISIEDITGPRY